MGGKIWVESNDGQGARFHFTMILNSAEEALSASSVPNLVRDVLPSNRRCLVIEHSQIVREHLCRDIGAVGLQGNSVANFDEAQNYLRSNRYSVIIVDGSLPRSEEFIRSVGDSTPSSRVIVTSYLGAAANIEGANVVTSVIKPIRRWRLFKALEQALNRSPTVIMEDEPVATPVEDQRKALATLAYRHPLRILVATLINYTNYSLPRTIQLIPRLPYSI
jgi:hypothetical protein